MNFLEEEINHAKIIEQVQGTAFVAALSTIAPNSFYKYNK